MKNRIKVGALAGLLFAELTVSGIAWAQSKAGNVRDIDIIVRRNPPGQNMACMFQGRPCSENVVRQVSAEAGKRGVSVSLAGSDGALRCMTRDGKECTDESVQIVQAAGRAVSTKGISGS